MATHDLGPRFADLAAAYMDAASRRGVQATQIVVLRLLCRRIGKLRVGSLTDETMSALQRERGVAGSTVRRYIAAINAVTAWAVRQRKLDAQRRPILTAPPDGAPRDVWLDEAAETRLWADLLAASPPEGQGLLGRATLFGCIALATAARKAAIEGLTWDRVDLAARTIDFRDPGLRVTKKRRVPVPVSDALLPVLQRAARERDQQPPGWDRRFVVGGGPIRRAWEAWTRRAGWQHVTPHVMRHTWATLAARAGVDMFSIAGVLGDTVETVTAHYAHHSPEHLRGAINARLRPAAPPPAPPKPAPPKPAPRPIPAPAPVSSPLAPPAAPAAGLSYSARILADQLSLALAKSNEP